mmetsp:Transcript_122309/g.191848  ORF Transcript_122309/g.191848 Transcript_122309/m.191848 type:complete len:205 (+) Transcript_122309:2390-3004(+)
MCSVAATDAIIMDLSAGSTWPSVAHLPEVIFHIERQDPTFWEILFPDCLSFLITRYPRLLGIASIIRRIKPCRINLVNIRQQVPRPSNSLLLEIIAERPISKHLEEGMMINILSDIFQVIVLSTGANAFLRIRCTFQLCERMLWINLSNKDGLKLIHASIDEQERWIVVRHHRRGFHKSMCALLLKVLDECLAHRRSIPSLWGT